MKIVARLLSVLTLVGAVALYTGCDSGGSSGKSDQDKQIELLNGTWAATEVYLDDVPQTGYENFTLTISGSAGNSTINYNTSGTPTASVWDDGGSFTFGSNVNQELIRDKDSDLETSINYGVTESTLNLDFTFSGAPINGRVTNVEGNWEFVFEKQ